MGLRQSLLGRDFPATEVGVLVGRFQLHDLHEGHIDLVNTVRQRHRKILILVGSTPGVLVTRNNPLDFLTRRLMLQAAWPDAVILPLRDTPNDVDWSRDLDLKISETFGDHVKATLYGSRDGFIPHYRGRHPTVELQPRVVVSASQVRRDISDDVRASAEFRRGVVYAAFHRHPVAFPTVDVAILGRSTTSGRVERILLGRKKTDVDGRHRFFGGFVDPGQDESLEAAAMREAHEETGGADLGPPSYVGSHRVTDWRYRNELDAIMTSLFAADYLHGPAHGADDIDATSWFDFESFQNDFQRILVTEHAPLAALLIAHLEKEHPHESDPSH